MNLWHELETIGQGVQNPWIVVGDYNNVLNSNDRVGGNPVHENKYKDLVEMMKRSGLFEANTKGSYYTWTNKSTSNPIYSIIDRMIGNSEWFQTFNDANTEVLLPGISDHAPIRVRIVKQEVQKRYLFKFLNYLTHDPTFFPLVQDSWQQEVRGSAMYSLWTKLRRLQPILKPLTKQVTGIKIQIQQARDSLMQAQTRLQQDLFYSRAIDQVKICTEQLGKLNQMEETMLKQKAKIDWLKLGDINNSFFHASIKEKNKHKGIHSMTTMDGIKFNTPEDIENEILMFYNKLVGTRLSRLEVIDLPAIRNGKIFSRESAQTLIKHVEEKEVWDALVSIGNSKAPVWMGSMPTFSKTLGRL
ncbi:uncharacterized protein LOC131613745 [Vicia villosa]|uniref:uncharacterized protein LOC131613745 n=1 Tax=Vicia villosa TaxID=3911 RepID=UPI00273B749C|nr:uncharacterized protein LOC131613745 [Vicia villosa]